MSNTIYDAEGNPVGVWDDVTRTYTGIGGDREYTPQENAEADARAVAELQASNESSVRTNLEGDLEWLQSKIGLTNSALTAEFNNNPAAFLKPLMRAVRRSVMVNLGTFDTPE